MTLNDEGEAAGFLSWLTTVDHKRVGIMYILTAAFFFIVAGIESLIMRIQLAVPNNDLVSAQTYNQVFTMHGVTMVFLVVMPLAAAFANYLLPLQIGARDVSFPRMNALSLWIWSASRSGPLAGSLANAASSRVLRSERGRPRRSLPR